MSSHKRMLWLVWFVVILAIGISTVTLILLNHVHANNDRIEALERHNARQRQVIEKALTLANQRQDEALVLVRKAAYRLCVREQRIRIAINLDRSRDEPSLVLYDCTPNLTGGAARPLTATQIRDCLRYVQNHHADLETHECANQKKTRS